MNRKLKPKYITEDFLDQRLEKFSRKLSTTIIKSIEKSTKKTIDASILNFKNEYVIPMFEITHKHMATKDDLKRFATKEDFKSCATKDDLNRFATKEDFKSCATKDDLNRFATKEDFKSCATKDDLNRFATKEDFKSCATKDDLNRFATKDDLNRFATKDDLNCFATKEDLNHFTNKSEFEELKMEVRKTGIIVEVMQKDLKAVASIASVILEHQELHKRHDKRLDAIEKNITVITTALRKKDV
ncbi:MAG: hypothetical protein SGI74_09660 [Oligoflexia bacterium]|nr:hypothetical protein [Oligoflexia bacterium]